MRKLEKRYGYLRKICVLVSLRKMRQSDIKIFFIQKWTYYIPIERKFYAEQKFQKNPYLKMKWKPGISRRTSKKEV